MMTFWLIIIAFLSTIFGQFFRVEIGGGGILFLDLFLPFVAFVWMLESLRAGENFVQKIFQSPLFWPAFTFLSCASISLFLGSSELSFSSFALSGFYLFRYFFLVLFAFIVADILKQNFFRQKIFLITCLFSAFSLAVLGFLQLKFFPDFRFMAEIGWDPHIGRLLSTWFDPNFLGGFFAFILALLGGVFAIWIQKNKKFFLKIFSQNFLPILLAGLAGILFLALLLTFSRSALLACGIPLFLLGVFYFRTLLVLGIIGISILLPFSPRAVERITDGVDSMVSIVQDEQKIFLPDPSSRLRIVNFAEGIDLAQKNFWTGVGFNTIREHRKINIHSSGGFDSSLLTVLVTTGIFGLISFLYLFFSLAKISFQNFFYSSDILHKGISLGFFCSIFGVLAQSFFINSLFFPFLMLFFFGVFGYVMGGGKER